MFNAQLSLTYNREYLLDLKYANRFPDGLDVSRRQYAIPAGGGDRPVDAVTQDGRTFQMKVTHAY